jgi:hypothetical protein
MGEREQRHKSTAGAGRPSQSLGCGHFQARGAANAGPRGKDRNRAPRETGSDVRCSCFSCSGVVVYQSLEALGATGAWLKAPNGVGGPLLPNLPEVCPFTSS